MTSPSNVFTIFTGDNKTMSMKIVQGSCSGDPVDLTGCTEIDVALPNADGTFSHRLLSDAQVTILSPEVLGKFTVTIPTIVSDLLNIGELQNIDVTFTIEGEPITVRFYDCFSVFELN